LGARGRLKEDCEEACGWAPMERRPRKGVEHCCRVSLARSSGNTTVLGQPLRGYESIQSCGGFSADRIRHSCPVLQTQVPGFVSSRHDLLRDLAWILHIILARSRGSQLRKACSHINRCSSAFHVRPSPPPGTGLAHGFWVAIGIPLALSRNLPSQYVF